MKLIAETTKYKIFRDGRRILKIGPAESIAWEAAILERLQGVQGIPSIESVMRSIDDPTLSTLITGYLPGDPLSKAVPGLPMDWVIQGLNSLIFAMYSRGVIHLNLTLDNILSTPDGVVGLTGFSGALIIEKGSSNKFFSSPDMTGVINDQLFTFSGPSGSVAPTATGHSLNEVLSLLRDKDIVC